MDNAKRALYGVDEALGEIRALKALVESKTNIFYVAGKPTDSLTTFGKIKVTGPAAAILLCDSLSGSIILNGLTIAGGTSPYIFVIPKGEGELTLSGVRYSAKALFFGAIKQIAAP